MKRQNNNIKLIVLVVLFTIHYSLFTIPVRAQIGTWRTYLAYHDIQQIQAASGDDIFVLASNDLYQYNKADQSIVTYDKINGLSDTYITHIRWCQQAKRLVAVYGNANIDLVETNGNVTNISSIYSKAIAGDKTINSITISNQYAYLACGFGIVKLNVKQAEIAESYMLGFPVTAIAFDNTHIYAQSTSGVYAASLSANLIDKSNWQQTGTYPSFEQDNSDYEKYYETISTLQPGGPKYNDFGFMKFINEKLYTCAGSYYKPGAVQVLSNNSWQIYQDDQISSTTGVTYQGLMCLDVEQTSQGDHVFAGGRNGMYEFLNGNFVKYYDYTNSPIERYDGQNKEYQIVTGVKFNGNALWILNSQAPTASLMKLENGQFTKYNKSELMKLEGNGFRNKSNGKLCNIMVDSRGLMWFVNDNWVRPAFYRYNPSTDEIKAYETFVNQDGSTIGNLFGVKYITEDLDNNIWIATDQGPFMLTKDDVLNDETTLTQVKVPRNDGTNYADYLLAGLNITAIAVDAGGRKWFATNGNGVYLISADNMTQLQHFTTENSNLLSDVVTSLAINNKTGEVFFGTENGLCSYISDATETNEDMTTDNVYAYPNPVTPGYTGLITIVGLAYNADVKILSANGALITEGRSNGGSFTWDGCNKSGQRVASGIYMVVTATSTGQKGTVCKIAIVN